MLLAVNPMIGRNRLSVVLASLYLFFPSSQMRQRREIDCSVHYRLSLDPNGPPQLLDA